MLKNIPIKYRLPAIVAVLILLAVLPLIGLAIHGQYGTIIHDSKKKLAALTSGRKDELQGYMESIRHDLAIQAGNPTIKQAIHAFDMAWDRLGSGQTDRLQRLYIHDNPHPTGEKDKLVNAGDGSRYSQVHAQYHPWFRDMLKRRGYYDIFLFDTNGDLIYTVFKELDYATNLITGKWRDSDLGKAFRAANQAQGPDNTFFFDFKPYAPSHGAAASFMSRPVYENGRKIGVLVYQMPIGRLNDIMQDSAGLGDTGETYLVGEDGLMRSDSRLLDESTILEREVDNAVFQKALSGTTAQGFTRDFHKRDVLAAAQPMTFMDTKWVVMASVTESELMAPVYSEIYRLLGIAVLAIAILTVIGVAVSHGIASPIARLSGVMRRIADGESDATIDLPETGDEVGQMTRAMRTFRDSLQEKEKLEKEQKENEKRQAEERRQALNKMADDFDSHVGKIVEAVNSAAQQMQSMASKLASSVEETSQQSSSVASAAQQAASNVETVASAAEELSSSIKEISGNISKTSEVAQTCAQSAKDSQQKLDALQKAVGEIDSVIQQINDVAEQTNLLALNATIEAARAGEAGKGFAVVANEVKSLAGQTHEMTDEITNRVTHVKTSANETIESIQTIVNQIADVDERAANVASSVEEQNSSTDEISRNIQQAAQGTNEVSKNIEGIQQAANDSAGSTDELKKAADDLARQADELNTSVQEFLSEVRS